MYDRNINMATKTYLMTNKRLKNFIIYIIKHIVEYQ